jgi:asparagine synthase (glutamine-hydrolysing)
VGRWIAPDGRWFLGHTRLSIIGLENGSQPISDASGDVQIVVNGEFYGYRAIRERLRAEGCVFTTDSDSEIALHLYLREGMNLGRQLRGEFAALIADRRNRAMLAIRDCFGIKPLFYAVHEGDVLFASEVKALLALGVLGGELPSDPGDPARPGGRLQRRGLARGDVLHERPRRREVPGEPRGAGCRDQGRVHR